MRRDDRPRPTAHHSRDCRGGRSGGPGAAMGAPATRSAVAIRALTHCGAATRSFLARCVTFASREDPKCHTPRPSNEVCLSPGDRREDPSRQGRATWLTSLQGRACAAETSLHPARNRGVRVHAAGTHSARPSAMESRREREACPAPYGGPACTTQLLPPSSVRRMRPHSPTAVPMFASTKETPQRFEAVPLD